MDIKGQTQLSIDVDKTTAYKCEECLYQKNLKTTKWVS